ERLDGEIERIRRVARPLEERPGPRGPQGLVTELVAGNEEDGSRSPQRDARCHRDCTATVAPVARCPNVTPVGTRAALHDATIWLRFALSPRSGRHRLLEVIMPASTPRLQSPCPLPRRAFLSAAAAAAGGLALACVDRATGVAMLPPLTASRLPDPEASGIEHVVLVMMENRSFDHFLGWLPGANGRQAGLTYIDSAGTGHATYPLAPDFQGCGHADPDHSYEGGRVEYDGGACDGWLRANDIFSIGYYQADDLPFLGRAVPQWTSFDRYFCAIMAPTFPNRVYQHAGQTDRISNTLDLSTLPTTWDRLAARGLEGRYYCGDVPAPAAPIPEADRVAGNADGLRGFRTPALLISPFARRARTSHHLYDHTSLLRLIEWRWSLEPLTVRDRTAHNLARELDFAQPLLAAPEYAVPPVIPTPCPARPMAIATTAPPSAALIRSRGSRLH